jgi:hypothetical protein
MFKCAGLFAKDDLEEALADYEHACALDPDHQRAAEERDKLLDTR